MKVWMAWSQIFEERAKAWMRWSQAYDPNAA